MNKQIFCAAAGIVGAALDMLVGGWCLHLTALVILMATDFLTGLALAIVWKRSSKSETGGPSSYSCWKGIIKKFITFGVVIAAYQADKIIEMDIVKKPVVIGFCVAEIISICENARDMGVLPPLVNRAFDKFFGTINSQKEDKHDE